MAKKKSVEKSSVKSAKVETKKKMSISRLSQKQVFSAVIIVAVLLLGVSGWAWWTKIVINPERVLDDAIANNLQTTSVTRKVVQDDGSQKVDQTSYLSFYAPTITAETSTAVSQKGIQRQETTVKTDSIGTNKVDFVRYSSVEGTENLPGAEGFKKLVGIWAKKEDNPQKGDQVSYLNEAIFSIIPVGNLDPKDRHQLLDLINKKDLYNYKTAERKIENYRPVYTYNMSINPADLIEVLAKYAQLTGAIDPQQFDPSVYANAPDVAIQTTVDIASRKIISINYGSSNRTETYSGYNLYRPITLPENTITIEELQQKLQEETQVQSS